jgi:hypothetical protein
MMFLWAFCGVPFSIYFISTRANMAVQVQPELFFCFCTIAWVQTLYYPPVQLPRKKIIIYVTTFVLFAAGSQAGFIAWLRPLHDRGIKWPTLIFGIIASVLLALGLVPPYFELAKRKGRVVGIHFLFLFVDMCGAFFSMLSVIVGNMDVMGIILYCICVAMEVGIFLSHFIWLCRFRWFGNDEEDEEEAIEIEPASKLTDTEKRADDITAESINASVEGEQRVSTTKSIQSIICAEPT